MTHCATKAMTYPMIFHRCTLLWTLRRVLECFIWQVLAAFKQNTAYVMMQIYLFVVCNHATEPNLPFFCKEEEEEEGRKYKKVTTDAVMQSRRGCGHECRTTFSSTSRAQPSGSLSPFSSTGLKGWVVSTHRGHVFFTSLLCAVHTGKTHKQKAFKSGKQ